MAKIVKRRKKLKLHRLIGLVFWVSLGLYFTSFLFLKSYNIALNKDLQTLKVQNEENQKELDIIRLDVAKYTEREYLMSICKEFGFELSFDSERIEYISAE